MWLIGAERQSRRSIGGEWTLEVMPALQAGQPVFDDCQHLGYIQSLVNAWKTQKVGPGQFEQRSSGSKPAFLQMHECPGQLDQSFVKCTIRTVSFRQPERLENIVRLVKQSTIEAFEISEIMRVQILIPASFDQRRNFCAFLAHRQSLDGDHCSPKLKIA